MKLLTALLFALSSVAVAAPVDVKITRSDGLSTIHHASGIGYLIAHFLESHK